MQMIKNKLGHMWKLKPKIQTQLRRDQIVHRRRVFPVRCGEQLQAGASRRATAHVWVARQAVRERQERILLLGASRRAAARSLQAGRPAIGQVGRTRVHQGAQHWTMGQTARAGAGLIVIGRQPQLRLEASRQEGSVQGRATSVHERELVSHRQHAVHHQRQEIQLKQGPHLLRLYRSKEGGHLLRKNYET
jgi:hypothetical protein